MLPHVSRTRAPAGAFVLSFVFTVTCGCGGSSSPAGPTPPHTDPLVGLTLTGDAASQAGATWTYVAQVSGTSYDLRGLLLKPQGAGPFPAVIISHGAGGNSLGYSRAIARVMVGWGVVCIATNYTHAGGVPVGSPGTSNDPGASGANVQRARQLVEILRGLGYVDANRIGLHGHSMGAFVTAATAGAHPDLFRVASHTAGGIRSDSIAGPAPTEMQILGIRAPYQMHHGDHDVVVSLGADQLFANALSVRGVTYELLVYPGADHDDVSNSALMLERVRAWYSSKGMF